MASVSVKALEQAPLDVVTGAYRVSSTVTKIQTENREELQNLSELVRDFVRSSGVQAGAVIVSSLHTTCAILINEWQDALIHDVKTHIQGLIASDAYYQHNDPALSDCDRHNADSHLRSLMLGTTLTLQVAEGELVLGEWQSVILAELDGPRERVIRLQAMGVAKDR